jgi:hypothetical protein
MVQSGFEVVLLDRSMSGGGPPAIIHYFQNFVFIILLNK